MYIPKNHNLTNITNTLKNITYKNINYIPHYHYQIHKNSKKYIPKCIHNNIYNVPQIYNHKKLNNKIHLIVCDTIQLLYNNNPQNQHHHKIHNIIIISTNPITINQLILKIINTNQIKNKLKPITKIHNKKHATHFLKNTTQLKLNKTNHNKITLKRIKLK